LLQEYHLLAVLGGTVISSPPAKKLVGVGITALLGIFLVLVWSTLMWLSVMLGNVVSRLPALPIF
jgi:hypothetical protein